MWIIWLISAAVLMLLEVLTGFIAAFCLAAGCLVAMVLALCDVSVSLQMWSVVVGMAVAFFVFAPMIKRWHERVIARASVPKTNMDALIGREAVLNDAVGAGELGRMMLDGDNWQVRNAEATAVPAGTRVKVVGYDSIVLTITPVS